MFLFLPAALAVYFLTPGRAKEAVLLAVSLVFYAFGCPEYIFLFIAALAVTVVLGRLMNRSKTKSAKRTFLILGVLMFLLALYHAFTLPKVETVVHERFDLMEQAREFVRTLKVFVTKPHLVTAICFILLFRLPEGLLTKIVPLFLTRSAAEGGLAMSDVDLVDAPETGATSGNLSRRRRRHSRDEWDDEEEEDF